MSALDMISNQIPCKQVQQQAIQKLLVQSVRSYKRYRVELMEKIVDEYEGKVSRIAILFYQSDQAEGQIDPLQYHLNRFFNEVENNQIHKYNLSVRVMMVVDNVVFIYMTTAKKLKHQAEYMIANIKNVPIFVFYLNCKDRDLVEAVKKYDSSLEYGVIWGSPYEKAKVKTNDRIKVKREKVEVIEDQQRKKIKRQ